MLPNNNNNLYNKELKTFTIEEANQLALRLLAAMLLILVVPFVAVHFKAFASYFSNFHFLVFLKDCLLFIFSIFIGIILHEFIHGLTWVLFVKERFRAITYGVMWKYLTPYCHCKGYLKVKHYIAGAIMPAILLGVLPTLWAFITGNIFIFFLGLYFIVAASGDFLIIYILKDESCNSYAKDHESLPGCIVYNLKVPNLD